jgi:cell division protein FtsB
MMSKSPVNILNLVFYVIFSLFAFWIGYIIIYGNGGINNRRKAALELQVLEDNIKELEQKRKQVEWEIENIRSNRAYIESYARELGYRKNGEIIFRFMKKKEEKPQG